MNRAQDQRQLLRKGTLFLDEIGEIPLDMQPYLLRELEEGKVSRWATTNRAAPQVGLEKKYQYCL